MNGHFLGGPIPAHGAAEVLHNEADGQHGAVVDDDRGGVQGVVTPLAVPAHGVVDPQVQGHAVLFQGHDAVGPIPAHRAAHGLKDGPDGQQSAAVADNRHGAVLVDVSGAAVDIHLGVADLQDNAGLCDSGKAGVQGLVGRQVHGGGTGDLGAAGGSGIPAVKGVTGQAGGRQGAVGPAVGDGQGLEDRAVHIKVHRVLLGGHRLIPGIQGAGAGGGDLGAVVPGTAGLRGIPAHKVVTLLDEVISVIGGTDFRGLGDDLFAVHVVMCGHHLHRICRVVGIEGDISRAVENSGGGDLGAAGGSGVPAVEGIALSGIGGGQFAVGLALGDRPDRHGGAILIQPEGCGEGLHRGGAGGGEGVGAALYLHPVKDAEELILIGGAGGQGDAHLGVDIIPGVIRRGAVGHIGDTLGVLFDLSSAGVAENHTHLGDLYSGRLGDLIHHHRVGVGDLLLGGVGRVGRQGELHVGNGFGAGASAVGHPGNPDDALQLRFDHADLGVDYVLEVAAGLVDDHVAAVAFAGVDGHVAIEPDDVAQLGHTQVGAQVGAAVAQLGAVGPEVEAELLIDAADKSGAVRPGV